MKPQPQLSDRWTHPEREGILVGRIGHGGVSSWAHATSKPFGSPTKPTRPNETQRLPRFEPRPAPISEPLPEMGVLAAIRKEIANRSNKLGVVLPGRTKFDFEERAEKVNRRTLEISTKFEEMYRKAAKATVRSKGKPAPIAPPIDILADCPPTSPEVLNQLKNNILPRE